MRVDSNVKMYKNSFLYYFMSCITENIITNPAGTLQFISM